MAANEVTVTFESTSGIQPVCPRVQVEGCDQQEPGTGSSHPGSVRRQGPPRRSSELGHPIRRKSVSSFTMAGPAANEHHTLQI
ncbi:hypothetical protein EYF80_005743 [Liparis tanakae]|uniref:Uncharacterized protein n=1 Tax=Liparis tanakae TaxID=230148 RepID=A0A4Z2J306_9TELE|nr:hypothetical protein EYF80_005743 [Liparis tanakae]